MRQNIKINEATEPAPAEGQKLFGQLAIPVGALMLR